jgi:hypothetical protein
VGRRDVPVGRMRAGNQERRAGRVAGKRAKGVGSSCGVCGAVREERAGERDHAGGTVHL